MRRIFMTSIFLFILIGISSLNAQNIDWNITGAGARASGFGGAFIGVADDATAVVWNPSGLAYLERPEASLVTKFVMDSYEVESDRYSYDESTSHFVPNFISGAYPFELAGRKMVAAIAYQRQLDFYYYSEEEYEVWGETLHIEDIGSGGADTFTPGIGVQVTPLISAGLSANIWMGKAKEEYTEECTLEEYTEYSYEAETSFSGFNLVLGALADLNTLENPIPLKVGMSIRTPFELEAEYSVEDVWGNEETETSIVEMPFMFGIGASYRLGENLTFAIDYEMRAYGKSEIKEKGQEDGSPLSESKENLNQFRIGAEYLLVTDFAVLPIRLGFQTVPTVYANYDDNYDPKDQVTGFGFAIGSGLIMERYALDVTYSHSGYEQKFSGLNLTAGHSSNILTLSGIFYF